MKSLENTNFLQLLANIPPTKLIPVLEKGLELEKLELIINPESEEVKEIIHYSTAVLTFLRLRRLGRAF